MRFTELFERAKDVVDELLPYKNENVFINYSDIIKIGINPRYSHNFSPIGFYGYPLKLVWNEVLEQDIPFAEERQYIQIFTVNQNCKILKISEYTMEKLHSDIEKLKNSDEETYLKLNNQIKFFSQYKKYINKPFLLLFKAIEKLSFGMIKPQFYMTKIFLKLGYDGIYDDKGKILNELRYQIVIFTSINIKLIKVIDNKRKHNIAFSDASLELKKSLTKIYGDLVSKINNMNEDEQLEILKRKPRLLKFMKNPSEKLLKRLVDFDGRMIEFIMNPSVKLQIRAVNNINNAIGSVSPKIQKFFIKKDIKYYRYLYNPSPQIQKFAIETNPKEMKRLFSKFTPENQKLLDSLCANLPKETPSRNKSSSGITYLPLDTVF